MSGHVLVLLENQPYPYDPRVRAQVEALCRAGWRTTVLGPTGHNHDALEESLGGVRVLRFPEPPQGGGVVGYAREFGVALFRLGRLVRRVDREDRIDVALVCSPPDLLVGLVHGLARRGTGIVFDDRELSPELFEAKYGRRGLVFRALVAAERYAVRRADAVLITNASYRGNITQRAGLDDRHVFVVGNGPDPSRVFPVRTRPELRRGRRYLVLWLGAMSQQEGLDVLVDAAEELVVRRGREDVTFAVVGPGDVRESLQADIERRGLTDAITVPGRVGDDLVRAYMSTADVCVGVDRRNQMNDRAAMRKVLEYMALGRAVVQFPLMEMQRLCGDATAWARDGDPVDLADHIAGLLDDEAARQRLGEAARQRLADQGLLWPDQIPALLAAVELARGCGRARGSSSGRRVLS